MSGRSKPFYFDSCRICEAVSQADNQGKSLSEEELIKAFKAQEAKNKGQSRGAGSIILSSIARQKLDAALTKVKGLIPNPSCC